MLVIKRDGKEVQFDFKKIEKAILAAAKSVNETLSESINEEYFLSQLNSYPDCKVSVEDIQNIVEKWLMRVNPIVAKEYILYREKHRVLRDFVKSKTDFIEAYKKSSNTANATVDDNSNVANKNIGILNNEIHKTDNIQISRGMVMHKLKELYPDFDPKLYIQDLEHHIIYKHDESSFAGAIAPYCCSITMYPFLTNGIKGIGGLSAAPKNLDSFCGMFINLIFATSAQFAGAVATSEFLLYFTYFCKKEWGEEFWKNPELKITQNTNREKTIRSQIHQYWQQIIYSINQPAAARGMQAAFVNFSYFDKPFFEGMFGDFVFPDGTKPDWESLQWIQKEFMKWFNEERLRCLMTFPVESFALVYQDGHFLDQDSADFVAEEYARGHSFFTYISDTVDSLSSCCRLRNMITTKEFNFTNGNMGVQTGSKSVITLNLNRIIQDYFIDFIPSDDNITDANEKKLSRFKNSKIWFKENKEQFYCTFTKYLNKILDRVYKYHTAYNELLWDTYEAKLLPVYSAGFIDLNKQYLTIGINGLNEAAEFLNIQCSDNKEYAEFCQKMFSTIKESNKKHAVTKGHKITFNTECVPAESLAIKNYNWDKKDGYEVPKNRNLYASYIFIPSDPSLSVLDKMKMHGKDYIGDYLDGGSASHINLSEHLSYIQYKHLLEFAAKVGCQYFTFNIPNCECDDCGFIAKQPFKKCPKCGSTKISLYDRVIGYLTKIKNWSQGRQIEQKTRVYSK